MSKDDMKRISEVVPMESVVEPIYKPREHLDTEFVLVSFEEKEGEMGDYHMLSILDPTTGEVILFSSGSFMVKAQLEVIVQETDLPLKIMFKQSGRSYYMV